MRRAWMVRGAAVLGVLLGGGALAWRAAETHRPQRAATSLIARVAGYPDIDSSGASCRATDERAGILGWRRGALCLRGNRKRLGAVNRSANGLMVSANAQWDHLGAVWAAHLVDSIGAAFQARGAKPIQITGKCPSLVPSNMLEQGAWQGAGYQAFLTEWGLDQNVEHRIQLEVTSTAFQFCPH